MNIITKIRGSEWRDERIKVTCTFKSVSGTESRCFTIYNGNLGSVYDTLWFAIKHEEIVGSHAPIPVGSKIEDVII